MAPHFKATLIFSINIWYISFYNFDFLAYFPYFEKKNIKDYYEITLLCPPPPTLLGNG
jgi:hypothetical protein